MKRLLIFLAALAVVPVYAQLDAKVLGMGGVSMTAIGISHPIYNNPAMGLFSQAPTQISSSYMGHNQADSYAVTGSYLFGFNNLALAGWQQSFVAGNGGNTMAVDVGYARRIKGKWAVGGVLRYEHWRLGPPTARVSDDMLTADLSAAYSVPLDGVGDFSTLRAGAKLSNLGGFLTNSGNNKLSKSIDAGAALDTFIGDTHEVTAGIDLGYMMNPADVRGFRMSVGAEYNLMQLFQFRAGYHYGSAKYFDPSYGSLGAGVRFLHLRLDFAYLFAAKDTYLRNAYSLSFGFDF